MNGIKSEVPPEVFTTEWKNPVNAQEGDYRKHQLEALKLFEAAGWKISSETADDPSCGFVLQIEGDDWIVFRLERRACFATPKASRCLSNF